MRSCSNTLSSTYHQIQINRTSSTLFHGQELDRNTFKYFDFCFRRFKNDILKSPKSCSCIFIKIAILKKIWNKRRFLINFKNVLEYFKNVFWTFTSVIKFNVDFMICKSIGKRKIKFIADIFTFTLSFSILKNEHRGGKLRPMD